VRTAVFGGVNVTKFIKVYASLISRMKTNPTFNNAIAKCLYPSSDTIQERNKITNRYWVNYSGLLKLELMDTL
jgi:hypothetical protein